MDWNPRLFCRVFSLINSPVKPLISGVWIVGRVNFPPSLGDFEVGLNVIPLVYYPYPLIGIVAPIVRRDSFTPIFQLFKVNQPSFPCLFCFVKLFIVKWLSMVTTDKQYKRQNREVSPETRQKISQSLKGRSNSFTHRTHIAQGVKTYWEQIPCKDDSGTTTIEDIML